MAVESSFKNMTLCLLAVCLASSALLGGVYALTKNPIDMAEAAKTGMAVSQVLPEFDGTPAADTVNVAGKDYVYYKAVKDSSVVGYAINTSSVGFGGPLTLMVGITDKGIIYNVSVLSQSETPGLGAKCKEPFFIDQFKGLNPEEKSLKVTKDGGDIDAITASTITSRAFVDAVASALSVYEVLSADK